jgi:16S rRNA (adenine1518-N6/adenine1519-N6)-dimethyltransferase
VSHPRAILDTLGAAARKSLSQNFLLSPHWADRLTDRTTAIAADAIWEIGPGLGALTLPLLAKAKVPVTLFEYDRKLAAYLRENIPGVDLVEGDVMDQDLETRSNGLRVSVLSNLPYHLSSAILFRLAELSTPPVQLVLTFQKEFARRVVALPSTPAYGAMSVLLQLQFEVESLGILPPGAFYPVPDVDSEALIFRPRSVGIPPAFRKMVRGAFAQRRKKLTSNLKKAVPGTHTDAALEKMGVNPNARPEELSPAQYRELGITVGLFVAEPSGSV